MVLEDAGEGQAQEACAPSPVMEGLSAPTPAEVHQGEAQQSNQGIALATLIVGAATLVVFPPLGIVAVIMGAVVVGKTRGSDRVMTIVGMALGGLAFVGFVLLLVFMGSMAGMWG